MKITAAVVPARGQPFETQELELAPPRAGEVLVEIAASGLCHTDLHARDGYFPNLPYPVVPGHEGAGIVAELGAGVSDLAVGDKVVISFPFCGECEPCRTEHPAYCTAARALKSSGRRADGFTPMSRHGVPVYSCFFQQSSFATYAIAPAKDIVKLRADASVELLGPLGCGLQTGAGAVLNVMQPHAGQSIAVFGVGGVGLAGLMAAKIAGCDPIIAVDVLPSRLSLAKELGATHAVESPRDLNLAETLAEIRDITGGGVQFSLETSAVPAVFRVAADALRGLGTCVLVGSARAGTEASFEMPVLQAGRTIRGVIQGDSRPREFIPRLVDLFMAGQFPLDRLVTRYNFADINQAAADATTGMTIKPVLNWPQ
ncbi:MAG TPA: NAD(P)-dependent alcohol dehydrogenase [Stellaceae bacterium]|jgi:aryl-alcohol dehydrogenase|nr:NAD(P)-dependent alcohol dehydrogenase [Stellaceae bacterium]